MPAASLTKQRLSTPHAQSSAEPTAMALSAATRILKES